MTLRQFTQAEENAYRERCAQLGISYRPQPTLDAKEGRRQELRQSRQKVIYDGTAVVCEASGVKPEFIPRLCQQAVTENLKTLEQQRGLIELTHQNCPLMFISEPKLVSEKEAANLRVERMNQVPPDQYAKWRQQQGLEVHSVHLRPVPAAPPTAPEDPDAAYAALRTRLGLPPSTSTSIDWARRQRERRGQ